MSLFIGAGTALITPFSGGEIDYVTLERLINWQIEESIDAIIISGTTGESPTLSREEKKSLLDFALTTVKGRVPVIAGTGTNSTSDSILLSKDAEALGADGLLVVTPYYNKPSQRGLYAHYEAIAEAVSLPVILYNVPGRTSVDLLPETVIALSKIPNITGLKEASGMPQRVEMLKGNVPEGFRIYTGNDPEIAEFMERGAHGVISVLSNVMPRLTHTLVSGSLEGKKEEARTLQKKAERLIEALFMETNPVPVKEALAFMGFGNPEFRLPLVGLETHHREELYEVLKQYEVV
ncbi:4-hydroxy-tetrahydrodipicolinate synthase [Proteiniclasticum ruminis]|uniref:4-hydroxy-tetrahydrodipicolinate synthase n=1 Tax=Proteiniclasticum ruminis TaxID=398199 RepID=A0A1G8HMA0_9CLOT|nr:4-hydroxy-tetrahydrodipicolinate synthase [Proteiniclasticum ruminis]SDI07631.1 4-hydroxy-tetrahydrodipicolinate synthase [Proteiniclasticum ruminis]